MKQNELVFIPGPKYVGGNPQQPLKHRPSGGGSSRAFFIAGSEADQDHHHQRSRHLLDTLEEVSSKQNKQFYKNEKGLSARFCPS